MQTCKVDDSYITGQKFTYRLIRCLKVRPFPMLGRCNRDATLPGRSPWYYANNWLLHCSKSFIAEPLLRCTFPSTTSGHNLGSVRTFTPPTKTISWMHADKALQIHRQMNSQRTTFKTRMQTHWFISFRYGALSDVWISNSSITQAKGKIVLLPWLFQSILTTLKRKRNHGICRKIQNILCRIKAATADTVSIRSRPLLQCRQTMKLVNEKLAWKVSGVLLFFLMMLLKQKTGVFFICLQQQDARKIHRGPFFCFLIAPSGEFASDRRRDESHTVCIIYTVENARSALETPEWTRLALWIRKGVNSPLRCEFSMSFPFFPLVGALCCLVSLWFRHGNAADAKSRSMRVVSSINTPRE